MEEVDKGDQSAHQAHGRGRCSGSPRSASVHNRRCAALFGRRRRSVPGIRRSNVGRISSVILAHASTLRDRANRNEIEGLQVFALDSVSFNAWFSAFAAADVVAERLAANRMSPAYRTVQGLAGHRPRAQARSIRAARPGILAPIREPPAKRGAFA